MDSLAGHRAFVRPSFRSLDSYSPKMGRFWMLRGSILAYEPSVDLVHMYLILVKVYMLRR